MVFLIGTYHWKDSCLRCDTRNFRWISFKRLVSVILDWELHNDVTIRINEPLWWQTYQQFSKRIFKLVEGVNSISKSLCFKFTKLMVYRRTYQHSTSFLPNRQRLNLIHCWMALWIKKWMADFYQQAGRLFGIAFSTSKSSLVM